MSDFKDDGRVVANMEEIEEMQRLGAALPESYRKKMRELQGARQTLIEPMNWRDRLVLIFMAYRSILPILLAYVGGFSLLLIVFLLLYGR